MTIHRPPPSSSSIPIVNCTTLHLPSHLFIYYSNSQMYDSSSTSPPLLPSNSSNVRLFIHHPPSSFTIPIVKCTTLHPPSPSSSITPIVKCTSLHPPSPCSSTIPIVICTTLHPPCRLFIYYPIVKCTTLHPPSPLFTSYPNSQMYDTSSTIPPVYLSQ